MKNRKKIRLNRHSFRVQMILTMGGITLAIIFLCWGVTRIFLDSYYERTKIKSLGTAFDKVSASMGSEEDLLVQQDNTELENFGINNNMNIYVFMVDPFFDKLRYIYLFPDSKEISEKQMYILNDKLHEYIGESADEWENKKELMYRCNEYAIYKVYDSRVKSNYLELFGQLENSSFVYIRANYSVMQLGISIFNRFLGYVSVIVAFVGIVVMFLISRRFTKPILEMADTAERMSKLDFHVKYNTKSKGEIGILGDSLNVLAEKLENTISELKSANNELQTDIQEKIQIDEMRKEFLSNVSHELKTPIALIQGYAEGLQDNINDSSESRQFYCEVIIDEAAKMNNMVKKLLSLNQIEFGNEQITFRQFDIVELIRAVISSAKLLADQKHARIRFKQAEPVFVWADEFLVEEVLTNYISNAINHVDGEKLIEVTLQKREDNLLRICVYNTGEPIPEDELEKVWIKFYKVDKARTREYGGNGIGLSIVKAIMNSLNRQCGVANRDDGVEFWFDLERADEEQDITS